jgi:hypothetical protein
LSQRARSFFLHLNRTWASWFCVKSWFSQQKAHVVHSRSSQLTLNRYARIVSDSSLVTPWIRRVKPLLTKTLFHPVTAVHGQCSVRIVMRNTILRFVRITGWTASSAEPWFSGDPRGIVRSGCPSLAASSWKNFASWTAVKVSKNAAIAGDKRS